MPEKHSGHPTKTEHAHIADQITDPMTTAKQ
jgi:hypothetical protein